jgi:outer membrane lipoprotein-sorting protein
MGFKDQRRQQGFAHLGIVVAVVVFLGVIALIVWRVWGSQLGLPGATPPSALQQALANAKCDVGDKDICKFYTSWKFSTSYKVTSTDVRDGQTTTSTFESADSGKRFHMSMMMSGKPYEVTTIDKTTYTRDVNGKWWKQTTQPSQDSTTKGSDYNYNFSDPASTTTVDKTTYKLIGREACGNLTCFKYQVVDPAATDQTQYIWFDTTDYQLRRMRTESKDDSTSDQSFSYTGVSINAPANATELQFNQVLNPTTGEVMTVPSQNDIQDQIDDALNGAQ